MIAAAGDIACGKASTGAQCKQMETSDLLLQINPDAVLLLGDVQYEEGEYDDFVKYYEPSWGRVKAKSYPAVGNHEYLTGGAAGYFDYFNGVGNFSGRAGDRDKGYYSFDLGAWHIIALNSNCSQVGGCGAGSPQEAWLRADLAAHPATCTLAYWHHPVFSSGQHGNYTSYDAWWRDLDRADADVVLVGHDHDYERFARQDASGSANPGGIREFVVGTGGRNHTRLGTLKANSEVFDSESFGVLVLSLHPTHYEWEFVPTAGATLADSGNEICVGAPADSTAPGQPRDLTASVVTDDRIDPSWSPSTDNLWVEGYRVLRDGTRIATTASTSYADGGLPNGTYRYEVAAYDAAGNVGEPATVSVVLDSMSPTTTLALRRYTADREVRLWVSGLRCPRRRGILPERGRREAFGG